MEIERFGNVAGFLRAAEAFLLAREAEHNLALGIAGTLRDHPEVYPQPAYLAVVSDGQRVLLAAVRTPPCGLVLSETGELAAVDKVVDDLAGRDRALAGVLGPVAVARAFAGRWTERTGIDARLAIAERIYRLTRVLPPERTVAGTCRFAEDRDRALLTEWMVAFQREATPTMPPLPDLDAAIDRWIRRVGRTMYLWDVDDLVVSMAGAGSPTPNGIRVGPVYTPPLHRGRGYASALTAAASRHQLESGRRFCFLFTDLANPTSNRIYQAVGYEPVTDVELYRFGDGSDDR